MAVLRAKELYSLSALKAIEIKGQNDINVAAVLTCVNLEISLQQNVEVLRCISQQWNIT